MKRTLGIIVFASFLSALEGQEPAPIVLNAPNRERGLPVMKALDVRASVREWSSEKLSIQDLSDLLWAANGINRPSEGKRTAPSAQNAQDISIYVFMEEGAYLYDAVKSLLVPVAAGDHRDLAGKTDAPVTLVLVTDISRFRGPGGRPPAAPPPPGAPPAGGPPAGQPPMSPSSADSLKLGWGNMDAGIVSQNISLFCAATGLKTRPRAGFPGATAMRKLLNLTDKQYILLNHPVGYPKK